jgi:hypothetical protein
MPKAKIYQPPRPKREPQAVTIKVMRNEIDTLLMRIDKLVKERDSARGECFAMKAQSEQITTLHQRIDELVRSMERLVGWRDCAREWMRMEKSK